MATSIDLQIRCDVANEAVRRYGELQQDFPRKMAKRLKRKFHTDLDVVAISTLADHFKEIYKFGSSILYNFIAPAKGGYASLESVKIDHLVSALFEQYPDEDKAILKIISDWLIYYEYLR